ncbi:DUF456 domain-containing protein [Bacillus massiliglaciei]|uniref:DUF456 domain-containing protein n=1 Tax=Bacillus massiliglaciei TaxID=1816693 RepID=UPI000B19ABEC|nr:DUF456 domain-containing protein [Bacillus massiliglaciei]
MDTLFWSIIILMFAIGFIGLIFPIIPSVLFIFIGIILYGFFYSFEPFNWFFWTVQILFVILLFAADYVANLMGIKRYGGSKAAIWGSTIGIVAGPFVIPFLGILIGPFIGAILAELLVHRKDLRTAARVGFGSVIGFVSSVLTKGIIQLLMVAYFLYAVFG